MSKALSEDIQKAAKSRDHSVNAEIIERLEAAPIAEELARLSNEVAELKAMVRQLLASIG